MGNEDGYKTYKSVDEMIDDWNKDIKWYDHVWWAIVRIPSTLILNPLRKLKWFFQRAFRGYSESDVWDVSGAIARYTIPLLKAFREKTIGVPLDLDQESNGGIDNSLKLWKYYISLMIFAFEYHLYITGDLPERGMKAFEKRYLIEGGYSVDYTLTKEAESRITYLKERADRGMGLFVKYYNDLWW